MSIHTFQAAESPAFWVLVQFGRAKQNSWISATQIRNRER